MITRRDRTKWSAIAFLAALVFVVQTSLSLWAGAVAAATPMLDAFGNPLCITSMDGDGAAPAGGHGAPTNCCTLGCSTAGLALAEPDLEAVPAFEPEVSPVEPRVAFLPSTVRSLDHDPASPRAPPAG